MFLILNSVADPDPGSGIFLTPGSRMGKKSISGIRDEHPGSYFRELRNNFLGLKYFGCGSGSRNLFEPGSGMEKIRIRDKHPGTATLTLLLSLATFFRKVKAGEPVPPTWQLWRITTAS
jgi:hypothetical protein